MITAQDARISTLTNERRLLEEEIRMVQSEILEATWGGRYVTVLDKILRDETVDKLKKSEFKVMCKNNKTFISWFLPKKSKK